MKMDGLTTTAAEDEVMNELATAGIPEPETSEAGTEETSETTTPEQPAAPQPPQRTAADLRQDYMRRMAEEQPQQQQQQRPAQPAARPAADPRETFLDELERDPIGAVRRLVAAEMAPIHQERQLVALESNMAPIAERYEQLHTEDGSAAFFAKVTEIAREMGNPGLVRNPSPRVLRMAAEDLWGVPSRAEAYSAGQEQGRAAAEAARAAKKAVAANPSAKPAAAAPSAEDELVDSIIAAGRRGNWFE